MRKITECNKNPCLQKLDSSRILNLGTYRGKFRQCLTCHDVQVCDSELYKTGEHWMSININALPSHIRNSINNICR